MKQQILATANGSSGTRSRWGMLCFRKRWSKCCRGPSLGVIEPHYAKEQATGGPRWVWSECCEFTFSSNASTCRTRYSSGAVRLGGDGAICGDPSERGRCRTKPRGVSSTNCWKNTPGKQILSA